MKKLMFAILMLCPALAQATTWTFDFNEPTTATNWTKTVSGLTVGSSALMVGLDCDSCTLHFPNSTTLSKCASHWEWPSDPDDETCTPSRVGGLSPADVYYNEGGNFANAPTPGHALAWEYILGPGSDASPCSNLLMPLFHFTPSGGKIKYAEITYSAAMMESVNCQPPQYGLCEQPGALGYLNEVYPEAAMLGLDWANSDCGWTITDPQHSRTPLIQDGSRWGTVRNFGAGCDGDPNGDFCSWKTARLWNPNGFDYLMLVVNTDSPYLTSSNPRVYIGKLVVSDVAPPPPDASHSDYAGGVVLTGTTDGIPAVSYALTVRDSNDNPVKDAVVRLNFDALGADMWIGIVDESHYDCDSHVATAITDEEGYAEFRLCGQLVVCNPAAATLYVDGDSWGTKPVSTMDVQANGEITSGDLSAVFTDYFGSGYCSRIDYDGDGEKDAGDLSVFYSHFFNDGTGGASVYCGKPSVPQSRPSRAVVAALPWAPQPWMPKPRKALASVMPNIRVVDTHATTEAAAQAPPAWSPRDGYYDVAGRRLEKPPAHGVYWEVKKGLPRKVVVVK